MVEWIDCQQIADDLLEKIANEVSDVKQTLGVTPRLDVILVGDDPASHVYVRNKVKRCERVGIDSHVHTLEASIATEQLLSLIDDLNHSTECHGIMVQLPLPKHIDSDRVIEAIHWEKDVDGLTSINQAKLLNNSHPRLEPCTPLAVIEILKAIGEEVAGKSATVIGRSRLFGKPMSLMLQNLDATVTMCHSKSNLVLPLKTSNLVISAIGQPKFFKADDFGVKQTLIDVGINRDEAWKLCGDIDANSFENAEGDWKITPVPRGVGLLTTTLLMSNTLKACILQHKKD